jgi:DNA-directed RNA polymerase specialized sigma24 family protein
VPVPAVPADADRAVSVLYAMYYRPLVRLATLLVPDLTAAEDIVQEAFAAMHTAWPRLTDADVALSYLRRAVVYRSRSVPQPRPAAGGQADRPALVSALWALPARQREVLVLQYFADLPETQVAAAAGISEEAVRSHLDLALSSIRATLPPVI